MTSQRFREATLVLQAFIYILSLVLQCNAL